MNGIDDGTDPLAGLDPLAHGGEKLTPELERELVQRQINALLLSDRVLAQQMAGLSQRVIQVETDLRAVTVQIAAMSTQMHEVGAALAANTETLASVREVLAVGRGVVRVGNGIGWLAKTVAAIGLLWAAFLAALHIRPPSP